MDSFTREEAMKYYTENDYRKQTVGGRLWSLPVRFRHEFLGDKVLWNNHIVSAKNTASASAPVDAIVVISLLRWATLNT